MSRSDNINAPAPGQHGFQKTHGLRRSPEYNVWNGMKHRCHNPNYGSYPRYGARGIFVCDEWRNSFITFYMDMGPRPSPKHSIEREDNNGPYAQWNCRWATLDIQANNKRRTKRDGTKTLRDIADQTGLDVRALRGRYNAGRRGEELSALDLRTGVPNIKNRGEGSSLSKVTETDVREIRRLVLGGMMQKDVAPLFGISRAAVNAIIRRGRWGWLD